jgi:hypothetical protein
MGNDYHIQVINPTDPTGSKITAIIPYRLILHYYKYLPVRYENFRVAKQVLENPARIFSGIRQYNEGGWCFTGKPRLWYVRSEVQSAFPTNLVFAVYLNSRYYLYEARAEFCADDDVHCPKDWKNRYGSLAWKSTS